ncbi:MAG: hypothetical protein ACRDZU_05810 [Acidimicrobiales bacterium]
MSSTTILLLVILVTIAVSMVIAVAIVRGSRARADTALAGLGTPLRKMAATALGRTDDTSDSLTGTGTLVLTSEEVAFAQWRPARLLRIRRADITRTDTTRDHLGKSMKDDVLRLTWREEGPNIEESVAFFVRDLDPWLHDLGGERTTPDPD